MQHLGGYVYMHAEFQPIPACGSYVPMYVPIDGNIASTS
jgi:hypothetical protein